MNKKQAIAALRSQLGKTGDVDTLSNSLWFIQTESYIISAFGLNSPEHRIFKSFSPFNKQTTQNDVTKITGRINTFLDNCVETITHKGIAQDLKPNFLYRLSDTWLTTIITLLLTVIFPLIFYIGYYIGKQEKSSQPTNDKSQQKSTERTKHN